LCARIAALTIDLVGYGTSAYGLSPYGGSASTLVVLSAWAISTHAVRVNLSSEPLHDDQFVLGDALNVLSWEVEVVGGAPRTVIGAVMNDDVTVDLTLLEALGSHLVEHEVTAVGLLSFLGFQATAPLTATFLGVVPTMDPIEAVFEGFRDRDIANPPFQLGRGLGAAGAPVIGPDGDYDTEAGPLLLRKLLIRRLGTPRGAIRHLQNYGHGIGIKKPLPSKGDLTALRAEIEAQMLEEPDVASARAQLTMDRSGVLFLRLDARPRTGAAFTIRMAGANGRLVEI